MLPRTILRALRPLLGLESPLDPVTRPGLQLMPQQPLMAEGIAQPALPLTVAVIRRLSLISPSSLIPARPHSDSARGGGAGQDQCSIGAA
jgi:hypothetical protein